jgi:hypothetical protein
MSADSETKRPSNPTACVNGMKTEPDFSVRSAEGCSAAGASSASGKHLKFQIKIKQKVKTDK